MVWGKPCSREPRPLLLWQDLAQDLASRWWSVRTSTGFAAGTEVNSRCLQNGSSPKQESPRSAKAAVKIHTTGHPSQVPNTNPTSIAFPAVRSCDVILFPQ